MKPILIIDSDADQFLLFVNFFESYCLFICFML